MAEGTELAKAYVQIMPSAKGFSAALAKEIGGESEKAGAGFGKKLSTAAAAGLAAATAATGAFVKSSIDAGSQFDASMSQVAATMGKTMAEMQSQVGAVDLAWGTFSGNLREYAMEMGKNTAFSATECADALNYMALAGYDTQTSMNMLPNVLNLAAAGGIELAMASDMVTDTQTAFGISLERTSQMVDEMAKAASTGNTSVQQLGDAFLTVGGLAQELNGGLVVLSDGTLAEVDGVQELEIALTAMANAGIKGSEAGTHMRNMLLKLSSPTSAGAARLEQLGISAFKSSGEMESLSNIFFDLSHSLGKLTQEEKLQAISDLFNTRDTAAVEALLSAVGEDWNAIGESILDASGSAQKMADTQLDNLAGDTTLFQSALEGAKIAISDALTPALREFVQFGTDSVSELTEAFSEGSFAGAMEALGGIISDAISMVVEMLPSVIEAGGALLGSLVSGLVDNLPMIADTAIQVVVTLANGIAKAYPELYPAVTQAIVDIAFTLIDNLPLILDAALQIIMGLADGILAAIPVLIDALPEIILSIVSFFTENVPQVIDGIIAVVLNALPQIIQAGITLLTSLVSALPDIIAAIVDVIPVIINSIVDAVVSAIPQIVQAGIDLLTSLIDALPEIVAAIVEAIPTIIDSIIDTVLNAIPQIVQAGIDLLVALIRALPQIIATIIQAIPTIISSIVNALVGNIDKIIVAGVQLFVALIENLPQIIAAIVKAVPQIIKSLVSSFGDGIKSMADVGLNLIKGIWNGISDAAAWLWNKVSGWCSDLLGKIKGFFGIHSPSKETAWMGEMLVAGLAGSIDQNGGKAIDAAGNMANGVLNAMDSLENGMDFSGVIQDATGSLENMSLSARIHSSLNSDMTLPHFENETDKSGGITVILNIASFINNGSEDIEAMADTLAEQLEFRMRQKEAALA